MLDKEVCLAIIGLIQVIVLAFIGYLNNRIGNGRKKQDKEN